MPGPAAPFIIAGVAAAFAAASQILKDLGLGGTSQSQQNKNVYTADSFKPPVSQAEILKKLRDDPVQQILRYDPQGGGPLVPKLQSAPSPSQRSVTEPQTVAGTTSAPATPAPAPEPPPPPPPPGPPTFQAVKAAPIDTVTFVDEPYDEGFYADILFEDFGGQELLSISRSDTVNGQKVSYQPFKDLGIIRDQYNPSSLLSIQETSDRFFANFLIKLNEKIPNVGNGPNGKNIYFDSSTGDGIIELVNVETEEQVEIQILNAGIIEDIGI